MATDEPLTIVQTITDPDRRTTEGNLLVASDGPVWRETDFFSTHRATCERRGYRVGNQIIEQ